ncbi:class I SAM-dependent methyltransferase [Guptibacillus spartinae]|uniref:class I SAM-dependent methyltransferase n=1 Tax=Guptibacillus spartinae TaxID=3025679 RepID=UPI002362781F|nr:class I SAM-dependent methyltransferase [Pseudalkalibacillus spartinae]
MTDLNYEEFYDKVGKINGWDFSNLQLTSEGAKWEFYEEVLKKVNDTDILLDIGTGGGENVLEIASSLLFLIGIDLSTSMAEAAQRNLLNSKASNVRFVQMSSENLLFPDGFFNVISSCHAPFHSQEVARVLKKDGVFLTQQVSEADKWNIKKAFGRGQAYELSDGILKDQYTRELKDAGFSEVRSFDYDATDYYKRPEDLLFLLTHTPIIPQFGEEERDYEILKSFIDNNRTADGIRTNSKRFLIIAKK